MVREIRAVWSYLKKILSDALSPTPHHLYVVVLIAIAVGALGTQTGLFALPFIKGPPPPYQGPTPSPSLEYRPFTSAALKAKFDSFGYTLDAVGGGHMPVPRIYATELPEDLDQIVSVEERKKLFLLTVLPLVLRVNERLDADRTRLSRLRRQRDAGKQLSSDDSDWLADLEELYGVDSGDLRTLAARVDRIPVSLALAQAAIESGWGTSRFATLGNALFGQWTESRNVRGVAPAEREEDMSHRIRTFLSPMRSVWKYALNLNTHAAYRTFRQARAAARRAGEPLSGNVLAMTLTSYSEKGAIYTDQLQTIIRVNRLSPLDNAKLASPIPSS